MPEIEDGFFSYQQQIGATQTLNVHPKIKGIALDPAIARKPAAGSTQEYAYQQGYLSLFKLRPNPTVQGCYYLNKHPLSRPLDPTAASIQSPHGIYPFVILETEQGLDLRIGTGGHYHTADKADCVIAAGDLYFTQDGNHGGFLSKITNQSGSYHVHSQDSEEGRRQYQDSLNAMRAVGLPMELFHEFRETFSKPLVFSRPSRPGLGCFGTGPTQRSAPTGRSNSDGPLIQKHRPIVV